MVMAVSSVEKSQSAFIAGERQKSRISLAQISLPIFAGDPNGHALLLLIDHQFQIGLANRFDVDREGVRSYGERKLYATPILVEPNARVPVEDGLEEPTGTGYEIARARLVVTVFTPHVERRPQVLAIALIEHRGCLLQLIKLQMSDRRIDQEHGVGLLDGRTDLVAFVLGMEVAFRVVQQRQTSGHLQQLLASALRHLVVVATVTRHELAEEQIVRRHHVRERIVRYIPVVLIRSHGPADVVLVGRVVILHPTLPEQCRVRHEIAHFPPQPVQVTGGVVVLPGGKRYIGRHVMLLVAILRATVRRHLGAGKSRLPRELDTLEPVLARVGTGTTADGGPILEHMGGIYRIHQQDGRIHPNLRVPEAVALVFLLHETSPSEPGRSEPMQIVLVRARGTRDVTDLPSAFLRRGGERGIEQELFRHRVRPYLHQLRNVRIRNANVMAEGLYGWIFHLNGHSAQLRVLLAGRYELGARLPAKVGGSLRTRDLYQPRLYDTHRTEPLHPDTVHQYRVVVPMGVQFVHDAIVGRFFHRHKLALLHVELISAGLRYSARGRR
uniref:Uncharacterized protein n=1 Tax=Anopheles farauti TaxID=69004 RepID=A0A182QCU6_9DIPT